MNQLVVAGMLFCVNVAAHAMGGGASVSAEQKWKEECSSCHLAYSPRLLTAENWHGVMVGLNKHFGANASMDAADVETVGAYLERQAGRGDKHSATTLRVTDTPWFKREHRKVSARAWTDKQVQSASNCTGCHANAAIGNWKARVPGSGYFWRDD
jgi:nitrate/TMAO reductase-like tetraheme cytochrome c subunit